MTNIFIAGFMASGKSSLGKKIAKHFKKHYIDLDSLIEEVENLSINKIFEEKGEPYFRFLETEILKKLDFENTVIALGGGTPCFHNNIEIIKAKGKLVYLQLPLKIIIGRLKQDKDNRPLVKNLNDDDLVKKVSELFHEREKFYLKADLCIDAQQSISKIKNQIASLL